MYEYLRECKNDLCCAAAIRPTVGFGISQYLWVKARRAGKLYHRLTLEAHLEKSIEWLFRAQEVTESGGVAGSYNLRSGWKIDYPETSGYILSSFLALARVGGGDELLSRAKRIADWEVEIQAPNGGMYSDADNLNTRVFNTGQVLLGWLDYINWREDENVMNAAVRAGRYLCEEQESDGSWVRDTHCGPRTYEARVDWALLKLFRLTGDVQYLDCARRNLEWILANQDDQTGWFENCGFHDDMPITHVLAYTYRGLIECSALELVELSDLELLKRAELGLRGLRQAVIERPLRGIPGMVPTDFDKNWHSESTDSCLTGNAQLAICYYRLEELVSGSGYGSFGDSLTDCLMQTQIVGGVTSAIEGAIPGSYPIDQGYMKLAFPNWAAKFFVDALLKRKHGKSVTLGG